MAGIGPATCAGGQARRRRVLRPAHNGRVQSKGTGASRGAKETMRARNRRKTHRGARSMCAGGRLKSGDVDPVSPAR
jgi:CelD/BcsL family acetyltransferase involved in cellulose biosynthesis